MAALAVVAAVSVGLPLKWMKQPSSVASAGIAWPGLLGKDSRWVAVVCLLGGIAVAALRSCGLMCAVLVVRGRQNKHLNPRQQALDQRCLCLANHTRRAGEAATVGCHGWRQQPNGLPHLARHVPRHL